MGMFKDLVVQICELYEQGLDAPRIAAMLNMPLADVDFVIDEYFEEMSE